MTPDPGSIPTEPDRRPVSTWVFAPAERLMTLAGGRPRTWLVDEHGAVREEEVPGLDPAPDPPGTWPEGTVPTAEQLAAWIVGLSPTRRASVLRVLLEDEEEARRCVQNDHAGEVAQLRGRVARLTSELATIRAGRAVELEDLVASVARSERDEVEAAHRVVALLVERLGGEVRLTHAELEDSDPPTLLTHDDPATFTGVITAVRARAERCPACAGDSGDEQPAAAPTPELETRSTDGT